MRTLEGLLPILLAVYLLWRHPRPLAIRLLPSVALLLMLLHLTAEGYRWQMIPMYMMTTILAISSWIKIRSSSDWKPIASYLTLIPLVLSMALPILLPVPVIPAPDGPYKVGTRSYELTDSSRKELYSGKDEARRFQIQVWYPAEPSPSDPRAGWMNHAAIFARALSEDELHLPPFFLDHLALVKLPAYKDSKVASSTDGYPIILFSHGWNGF